MELCDYCGAEAALRSAILADPSFAPAYNNLGEALFKQGKYQAASLQFQQAANLAPESHKPPANLGLVYETVGRLNDAAEQYRIARDIAPQDPHVLGNLARTKIRLEENDDELHHLLRESMLYETRPEWRRWTEERLARLESSFADSSSESLGDSATNTLNKEAYDEDRVGPDYEELPLAAPQR